MPLLSRLLLSAFLLLTTLPAAARPQAMDAADLPPVDSVFRLSASAPARDRIEVRWKIAPGYYLYRHRTQVEALGGFQAGALQIPDGTPHHDEFFGDVETYRGELKVSLPGNASADRIALRIKYQGCADIGVCYPPQTRTVNVQLPAATTAAGSDSGFAALGARLGGRGQAGSLIPGQKGAPLPPEQAFPIQAMADGGERLLLRITPAAGYYVYRDKLQLKLDGGPGITLGEVRLPPGRAHRDEYFGNVQVWFDEVNATLPLQRSGAGSAAREVRLQIGWQGCQDGGICYEPMRRTLRIALPAASAAAGSTPAAEAEPVGAIESGRVTDAEPLVDAGTPTDDSAPASDESASEPSFADPVAQVADPATDAAAAGSQRRPLGLAAALLLALGGGLILNLMPCVLPVLSLKALGLAQSGHSRATARGHALWYTLGVLSAFAVLAAIVLALRGQILAEGMGWGFQLQMPWVVAILALLVFALGLSLSGMWFANLRAPQAGMALATGGGRRGDFFTGVLAVALATPCTAPFMGAALAYAFLAPALAAFLVFMALGLGLALPFLLIGFVPALARFLPRPGAWMETLKQLLAFPMYATAAWLVWVLVQQRGADAFALWAGAAITLTLALWAWTHARRHGRRWPLGLALLALAASVFAVVMIERIERPQATTTTVAADGHVAYSPEALATLRAEGRPVFVNITADWCVTCKANERTVFAREGFRQALAETGAVYMVGDHTDVDPVISAFLQQHGAVGLPLYVVYPRDGGAPSILPTLLTPAIARDALHAAAR
ncbi:protein-disulfide reductase DsbD family protein [Luteimonas sp. e5]